MLPRANSRGRGAFILLLRLGGHWTLWRDTGRMGLTLALRLASETAETTAEYWQP